MSEVNSINSKVTITTTQCEILSEKKWNKNLVQIIAFAGIPGKGQLKVAFDNNPGACKFVIIGENGIMKDPEAIAYKHRNNKKYALKYKLTELSVRPNFERAMVSARAEIELTTKEKLKPLPNNNSSNNAQKNSSFYNSSISSFIKISPK